MNLRFFAAPDDFHLLLEACLAEPGSQLFEAYSQFNEEVRVFLSSSAAVQALALGHDPHGTGNAGFLTLWAPTVMPHPTVRRFDITSRKYPPGTWRETTEGCGLFRLHTGGIHHQAIIASTMDAFTERGARAKCGVRPGPEAVDWAAHSSLTRRLTRLIRRQLAVARAGPYPVLPAALQSHRAGTRLVLTPNGEEFVVEAA
jgi:hypothetical protein